MFHNLYGRDRSDVEDIVREVFDELVEANHLLMPVDHVTTSYAESVGKF